MKLCVRECRPIAEYRNEIIQRRGYLVAKNGVERGEAGGKEIDGTKREEEEDSRGMRHEFV